MYFKAIDKEISARSTGISLNNMNAFERQKAFDEWSGVYCEFYPSLKEAETHLPFVVKTPKSPILSIIHGIYVIKGQENLVDTVICHFENGVNGVTLTIIRNASKIEDHFTTIHERDGNNPLMIGWLDGDLFYILCDGWEDCHSKEELEEIHTSFI